jgi:hypothetical protein
MSSIGTPVLESSETKLCRNSRGCPLRSLQAGRSRHGPERTPHIRRVELRAVPSGEHEIVVHPPLPHPNSLTQLAVSVLDHLPVGMPSCVAKQVTKPIRNREAQVTEPDVA